MRIFYVNTNELIKSSPEIGSFNLKADGIVIQKPVILFRNKDEAQAAIDAAHKAMIMNMEAEAKPND